VFIVFGSIPIPPSIQIQLYKIRKTKVGYIPFTFSNYFNHFFAFLDKSPKLTSTASSMLSMSFGPKLVGLKSSVGMIKFLFIIPSVNRNVLT
jgi:hypothetical protein